MIENSTQVFGPPGCGKTEFLMREIDKSLASGIKPERIAFVSFSRKSIEEARERAMTRFNLNPKQLVNFRTLHSTGYMELGITRDMVLSTADYTELGRMLGEEFVVNTKPEDGLLVPTDLRRGSRYLAIIDRARYRMIGLEEEWKDHDTFDLSLFKAKQIQGQLAEYKAKIEKVDFVDMIEMFINNCTPRHLDVLIVDEAQDLTPLQWKMVAKMAQYSEVVWLAGDDDQAIHRWTGVDVKQFIRMSENRIILDQSYRLPRRVFEVGERIVKRIKDRVPKAYRPTPEEGKVTWHYEMDSLPLERGSWTIMARTNAYVTELAKVVRNMGYYYTVKGQAPISKEQARAIQTWRSLANGNSVQLHLIQELYEVVPKQGDRAVVKRGSKKLLEAADPMGLLCMEELEAEFGMIPQRDLMGYYDPFRVLNLGDEMRLYLQHVEASGEDITKPPRIKLSTFHAMKGGEDDNCAVYLATTKTCEESRYPDDEHRAFYVGVTRAKKELHVVESNKRYKYPL
jgi:superfamily I DNA/RNA helicase